MSHYCIGNPCWICNPSYAPSEGSWQDVNGNRMFIPHRKAEQGNFFPAAQKMSYVLIELSESNGDIWSVSSHESLEAAQQAAQDKVDAYLKEFDQDAFDPDVWDEIKDTQLGWAPQQTVWETDPVNITMNDPVYFRIYDCTRK